MKTDILILGAGIGGFETFRTLNKLLRRHGLKKKITIVDQNNYFTFVPLLHEVASGAVEASHAALPLRELVYKTPHEFIKARIEKIFPEDKKVLTSEGEITYEFCVVAIGSSVNFYGVPGAKQFCHTVRTLPAAIELRETIIDKIEGRDNDTAITVVGGGYTGVEVVGQLAYFVQHDLKKLYPTDKVTINLIQNSGVLIPVMPKRAQELSARRLRALGVNIIFNKNVDKVESGSIVLSGTTIKSDITVWCAGNENDMALCLDPNYCSKGRLPVTQFLNHAMNATLYGVGDIIMGHNVNESDKLYPQLGEAAHKQGIYVARHIVATLRGQKIKPFYFHSLGTLMPIGDRYGLIITKHFVLAGLLAWWIRRTVYVFFMPGISRKLKIVLDWTLRLFGFRYIIDIKKVSKL